MHVFNCDIHIHAGICETSCRHLMAVATAFRDMEMLMLNNGHSGGTSVNYMLPAARSSELHASQVAFLARLPPISLKNAT